MSEKAYEKHAWILLFAIGIIGLVFVPFELLGTPLDPGVVRGLSGMSWEEIVTRNPGVARLTSEILRSAGVFLGAWAIAGMAIAAIPYRKGERWA